MPELRGSAGIGIAAVLLIAAGGIFYYFGGHRGYHAINSSYFVDEETGEESVHPLTDIPPLIGKSGKSTLVREVKYSLDGGKTVKVAYYLKFNDATKKKLEDLF